MRLVFLLLLASVLLSLPAAAAPVRRAARPGDTRTQPGDTLHLFLLSPGYRLALRDSVYLCRTDVQLKTFLQGHARGISCASIESGSEESVDSVMELMRLLNRLHIRIATSDDL